MFSNCLAVFWLFVCCFFVFLRTIHCFLKTFCADVSGNVLWSLQKKLQHVTLGRGSYSGYFLQFPENFLIFCPESLCRCSWYYFDGHYTETYFSQHLPPPPFFGSFSVFFLECPFFSWKSRLRFSHDNLLTCSWYFPDSHCIRRNFHASSLSRGVDLEVLWFFEEVCSMFSH